MSLGMKSNEQLLKYLSNDLSLTIRIFELTRRILSLQSFLICDAKMYFCLLFGRFWFAALLQLV